MKFNPRSTLPLAGLLLLSGLIYFGLDYWLDLPPTGLEFHSEIVRARPDGASIHFQCEFVFLAHHPRKTEYPIAFPTGQSGQAPPEHVKVIVDGKEIATAILSQGFLYTMPVRPGQESRTTIEYDIAAPRKSAVYVTRTANLWPKPLARARFEIPPGAKSSYHRPGETSAEFANFHPNQDWTISWGP